VLVIALEGIRHAVERAGKESKMARDEVERHAYAVELSVHALKSGGTW
jgi:hypothetical protein